MKISVVYAGDSGVIQCAGVSMISLFENNRGVEEILVYFIEDGISEGEKNLLTSIVQRYQREIIFLQVNQIIGNINIYDSKFPLSSFGRLFAQRIDEEKLLYLDCDTLVLNNIEMLYNTNLASCWFGAVQDLVDLEYRKKIGLTYEDRYVNAGVLLINNKRLKEIDFAKKAVCFIEEYHKKYGGMVKHNDQGVINGTAKGNILYLHPKYNVMSPMLLYNEQDAMKIFDMDEYYSEELLDEAKGNPVIVHFVAGTYGRPWQKRCSHPLRGEYVRYLNLSPWRGQYDKNTLPIRRRVDGVLYKILPLNMYIRIKKGYSNHKNEIKN